MEARVKKSIEISQLKLRLVAQTNADWSRKYFVNENI